MEQVFIKSNVMPFPHFAKRNVTLEKTTDARELGDAHFISLIEEGLKTESVSLDEVMNVLKQ